VGRRSSIDRLDPVIREEVDAAIKRGATVDEITWTLKGLGADVSRSAVGRYSKQYRDLAHRQRDMQSIAKAFGQEFGGADDLQGRLMVQLLTSLITRVAMPIAAGDEVEGVDFKDLHYLARAVKDASSAAKTDVDREAKIRTEEARRAREKAAAEGAAAAKAAGASEETAAFIRAKILGIEPAKPKGGAS
jgi:hypothetical protein